MRPPNRSPKSVYESSPGPQIPVFRRVGPNRRAIARLDGVPLHVSLPDAESRPRTELLIRDELEYLQRFPPTRQGDVQRLRARRQGRTYDPSVWAASDHKPRSSPEGFPSPRLGPSPRRFQE